MNQPKTYAVIVACAAILTLGAFQVDPGSTPASGRATAFELPASTPGGFEWVDVDQDGLPDLFVSATALGDRLLLNRGDGSFEDRTDALGLAQVPGSTFAAWADYDGDGFPDLYRGAPGRPGTLLHNDGGMLFEEATAEAGVAHAGPDLLARWSDFDLDGDSDLHVVSASGVRLYRNEDGDTLRPVDLGLPGRAPGDAVALGILRSGTEGEQAPPVPGAGAATRVDRGRTPVVPTGRTALPPTLAPGSSGGRGTIQTPYGTAVDFMATVVQICATTVEDQNNPGTCLEASSRPALGSLYPLTSELNVNASTGRVGVGTTTPNGYLHVVDSVGTGFPTLQLEGTGTGGSDCFLMFGNTGSSPRIMETATEQINVIADAGVGFGPGNVGIRVDPTAHVLTVLSDDEETMRLIGPDGSFGHGARLNFGDSDYVYIDEDVDDHLQIESRLGTKITSSVSSIPLEVDGRCKVDELEITGGADLVESFDTGGAACEPGTVLVIASDAPGRLEPSSRAYDRRVAGVVSGAGGVNPGIRMRQEGELDGDTLVALAGRVHVRCSAENGPIVPGDLLTTAGTAGRAMRADDGARSHGAVLGKAMSSLDEGTGLVLVLVNLQ